MLLIEKIRKETLLLAAGITLSAVTLAQPANDSYEDHFTHQIGLSLEDTDFGSFSKSGVEITSLQHLQSPDSHVFLIKSKNYENEELNCKSYVELTNLSTSESRIVATRQIDLQKGKEREFTLTLPSDLAPGSYTAIAVVDYGNDSHIAATEYELIIE